MWGGWSVWMWGGAPRSEAVMLTNQQVAELLGREVEEIHLSVALHEMQGIDSATVADIFAVPEEEILEIIALPEYQEVKRCVAVHMAQYSAQTDVSWDSLEFTALKKLQDTCKYSNDPEFHLKLAAVANKAQRRNRKTAGTLLNAAEPGLRVNLTLTERFVNKLIHGSQQNEQVRAVERRIDIEQASKYKIPANALQKLLAPRVDTDAIDIALAESFGLAAIG